MKTKRTFSERIKSDPMSYFIALYAIFGSLWFFIEQTSKLFRPQAAKAAMLDSALGQFDWGFVWADTFVPAPLLLVGGMLLLLWSSSRLGQLFAFAGFAINLYATIFLIIGLRALGHPIVGTNLFVLVLVALLGLLSMIWLAVTIARERPVFHSR